MRRFYVAVALAASVVVFAGFARTYYLKGLFDTSELALLLHLHGAVMTAWFALLVTQAWLVSRRQVTLHRRLGVAGGIVAALAVVLGVLVAVDAARRGSTPGPPPLVFLAVPLFDIVVFGGLVGAALALRTRPQDHRRLMLLASLSILPAAVARIPLGAIASLGPIAFFGLPDLAILACIAYDARASRRLHPAFLWGGLAVLASQPLRVALASTDAWMRFATWATS